MVAFGAAISLLAALLLPQPPRPLPAKGPSSPLQRVVFLGASLSAGFGNLLPLHLTLEKILEKKASVQVKDKATSLFFMRPLATGKFQVDKALAFRPTLVIAADFLFWYLYGSIPEEKRLARLEKGLKQLERLGKVPILLGDIPDMHGASPSMLPRASIPSRKTLARANERIRAWAAKRPQVHLFPLADFTARAKKRGWLLKPLAWEKGAFEPRRLGPDLLLQKDRLHPSRAGTWLLARLLYEFLEKELPALPRGALRVPGKWILRELPKARGKVPEADRPGKEEEGKGGKRVSRKTAPPARKGRG